jgi:hypothetical protein
MTFENGLGLSITKNVRAKIRQSRIFARTIFASANPRFHRASGLPRHFGIRLGKKIFRTIPIDGNSGTGSW